jgi:hypothetical protein
VKLRGLLPYIAIGVIITPVSAIVISRDFARWPYIFLDVSVPGAMIGLAAAFLSAHKLVATVGALLGGIALDVATLITILSIGKIVGSVPPAIEWLVRLIAPRHQRSS